MPSAVVEIGWWLAFGNWGWDCRCSRRGAFYAYVDVSATGLGSADFCRRLLDEQGVAVTPGTDFGTIDAERFVRFAYTVEEKRIAEALDRLAAFLA